MHTCHDSYCTDAGFKEAGHLVTSATEKANTEGKEVYLEVTPGRKPLVSGAILALTKIHVNRVLCLMMEPFDDVSKPYLMIPLKRAHT